MLFKFIDVLAYQDHTKVLLKLKKCVLWNGVVYWRLRLCWLCRWLLEELLTTIYNNCCKYLKFWNCIQLLIPKNINLQIEFFWEQYRHTYSEWTLVFPRGVVVIHWSFRGNTYNSKVKNIFLIYFLSLIFKLFLMCSIANRSILAKAEGKKQTIHFMDMNPFHMQLLLQYMYR